VAEALEDPFEPDWLGTPEGVAEALDEPWDPGWPGTPEGETEALEEPCEPEILGELEGIVTALDEAALEDAWELGSAEGETDVAGVLEATGETDGVLMGTETLVNEEVPQLSTSEMFVTSTVESPPLKHSTMMMISEDESVAVHCLEIVAQEPIVVKGLAPSSLPPIVISTSQLEVPALWR
jgi:hypothetical protein